MIQHDKLSELRGNEKLKEKCSNDQGRSYRKEKQESAVTA